MQQHKPYKDGVYDLICEARLKSGPEVTMIVCRDADDSVWTRPRDVFFELVEVEGAKAARMATDGREVFFKLPTPKWELLLNLKDGELCEAIPQGILAYTKAWEIMIADADTLRVVVKGA